ncbi:BgTH12-04539 [Blumeria graminis f. sp. triticale]|uniref:BgTH12-04539 n=1 Tax=Blumeria graminis f. sp. triticale TaxID=1689686 RepID=A0A9W4DG67_BLUGR|nr:BgTH12-04539 [Blumeria graminis f. sp. triticale]
MSDCQSSPTEHTTILGVNKKLNDSLAAINNRIQLLENKLEASIEKSNQRFNRAEK